MAVARHAHRRADRSGDDAWQNSTNVRHSWRGDGRLEGVPFLHKGKARYELANVVA